MGRDRGRTNLPMILTTLPIECASAKDKASSVGRRKPLPVISKQRENRDFSHGQNNRNVLKM